MPQKNLKLDCWPRRGNQMPFRLHGQAKVHSGVPLGQCLACWHCPSGNWAVLSVHLGNAQWAVPGVGLVRGGASEGEGL